KPFSKTRTYSGSDRYTLCPLLQWFSLRSFCDAIISVQSQTFRAHRLVLACASRALAQHLAKSNADSPAHCTLEYFSPHTFQQVLDFTYTQALEVPVKDLQQLLRAAQVLEMQLLEDQCRKQLDSLKAREKDKNGEAVDLTEEDKSVEEKDQKQKGRPVPEDKSPKRKAKLSPMSATPFNRDSVITRPNTSGSSFSSAWAFPTNMWDNGNHLNTLMRIAGNYSNFFASHPLPSSNQTSVVCPFPLSSQHMFPLLSSHFQTPLQSTALGYSRLHPHPYTQNLYTETSRMGQNCDGCQFCGRDAVQHEANARDHRGEKPYQCKHCPKKFSLKHQLDTHHRVHTGEKPFECRLCGQRSRDYSAMIKHLRTHGGAAPYQCTVCLEFCSSLVAMQRHVKSHAVQDFPPDWSINNTYFVQRRQTKASGDTYSITQSLSPLH
uniref:Zinc finger and BTB domain containing 32 n=1 Tax=Xiphophorus maculatus TaxID=8083 RepID=A0A3B5R4E7_XIPMA